MIGTAAPDEVLTGCAREPIHIPGSIQPHGILLLFDPSDGVVVQCSENVRAVLGSSAQELCGRSIYDLIATNHETSLAALLREGDEKQWNPFEVHVPNDGTDATWSATAHREGALVFLEIEENREPGAKLGGNFYHQVRESVSRLQQAQSLAEASNVMAEEIRRLTGFDRTLVYQFDEDWNGVVVAELREAHMNEYLGLRFPASDIPAQARALYLRNWLRLIPDIDYEPSRLWPLLNPRTGAPTDLSSVSLRSVSPTHLQYMRNMGDCRAAMSVSILKDGALWGLISCHHAEPRYLSFSVRSACEFLGQIFSYQMTAIELRGRAEEEARSTKEIAAIAASLARSRVLGDGLAEHAPRLLALVGAAGMVARVGDRIVTAGECCTAARAEQLLAALPSHSDEGLFCDSSLPAHWPTLAEISESAGILSIELSQELGQYLVWLRPELPRMVFWGGDPRKPTEETGDGAQSLSPRRSFAAWRETVRGQASAWTENQRAAARKVRAMLLAEQVARSVVELKRSNRELDDYGYVVSHDLKEPLRGISHCVEFLVEDEGANLSASTAERLRQINQLVARASELLSSLYSFSRLGRLEHGFHETNLDDVLHEVLRSLAAEIENKHVHIAVPRPLPVVVCDRVRIAGVLQNLVSNALRYNDKTEKLVEIGYRDEENGPCFYVRDNGVGIPAKFREAVFRMFKRLHTRDKFADGSGIGLTIAKKSIEQHGGKIWCEEAPGGGTIFFFTLSGERPRSMGQWS